MYKSFLKGSGKTAVVFCCAIVLFAKFVRVSTPFMYQYVLDTVSTGAVSVSPVFRSIFPFVDNGVLNVFQGSFFLIAVYTVSKIFAQFLQSANDVLFARTVQPAVRVFGREALASLYRMPLSFHTGSNTGALTRSMERGMRAIIAVLSRLLLHLVPQAIELLLVSAIVWWKAGPELALVCFATVAVYCAFTIQTVQQRAHYLEEMNKSDNLATNRLLDGLLHYEAVTLNNRQSHEILRYDEKIVDYQRAQLKSSISLAVLNWGQKCIEALGSGYLLFRTASSVLSGTMTVGEMIMINTLLLQLMGPLDHLGANYMFLMQGMVDAKEMFRIIQDKSSQENDRETAKPLLVSRGDVEFKNIHFSYVDHAGQEDKGRSHKEHVLCGLDLKIPGGSYVAVVGESGCGKSTLTRLLTRTVTAKEGDVIVDGQDVRDVTFQSLRDNVALVHQDPSLFNEDIAYNIAYGKYGCTEEVCEALSAAESAQLQPVIAKMNNGIYSMVGDRGQRLSGGQRQRVALARALVKDAPILICDEATSALDVKTESNMMDRLRDLRRGKTTLLIAHRLSSIVNCDEIIVMHQGKVVERGPHAELLGLNGRYAAMWAQQAKEGSKVVEDDAVSEDLVEVAVGSSMSSDSGCGCGHAH
ncbi:hypothetical protein GUITHDRAFT_87943 [Guillardia theta CCMP2712]|uniref:ABC transporter n=1 Tax=Guillardia theta (strain CCMP2712) TaxID=905079 RepID=L1J3B9_GUITC|nr:hypothetical protein GUITHDRAFT_87943 [Guillardia theta CCMP2712]EKX42782.1 hypothetical protein GUITHDRAFT_87943 [Guillardia theta CCMP2712]|eukprot:XP_005829762.1 hypothetical protein GUITHDRAFT_87943 [Guillardia theta CCMP2712]